MAGGGVRPAKAALAPMMLAGCFRPSYSPQAATYTDVPAGIARKGAGLVDNGRFVAETMPEFTYPLERMVAEGRV